MTIWEITARVDTRERNLGLRNWCTTNRLRIEHALSYLPVLTYSQVNKQLDSMIRQGVSSCLEFSPKDSSFVPIDNTARVVSSAAHYYDNRHRTPWKLPVLGCIDPSRMLREVAECCRTYPDCYICLTAFDSA